MSIIEKMLKIEVPEWLKKDAFEFNLRELLTDSFYYPASGTDGSIVRNFNNNVYSFVYVDAAITRDNLNKDIIENPFKDFHIIHQEDIDLSHVIPTYNKFYIPAEEITDVNNPNPFCVWFIFENNDKKRFSLLYISAEATSVYNELYNLNKINTYAVAFRHVDGFSSNIIKFLEKDKDDQILFENIMMSNNCYPFYFICDKHHQYEYYQHLLGKNEDLSIYRVSK